MRRRHAARAVHSVMKILFVPGPKDLVAHYLPLLALNRMLGGTSFETAFLVPRSNHGTMRQFGVNVLDIDHIGFRTEVLAYKKFKPDVVVDDTSVTTGYAT